MLDKCFYEENHISKDVARDSHTWVNQNINGYDNLLVSTNDEGTPNFAHFWHVQKNQSFPDFEEGID